MMKRILTLALAAVLALAVCVSGSFAEEMVEKSTYYVYTENGMGLNGEAVQVQSFINDSWALIEFKDDQPGYVNTRYLIDIKPEELQKIVEEEEKTITGDPLTDIDAEYASAVDVDDYKITARPARVTSMVNMRWIPSETGRVIAQYKATEALIVLKEMDHYLQVQDPDTGDVGYIHKKFAARQ